MTLGGRDNCSSPGLKRRAVGAALILAMSLVTLSTPVWAEQLKVVDSDGGLKSMIELSAGSSAEVIVQLKSNEGLASGIWVMLRDTQNQGGKTLSAISNNIGSARFANVGAGTYQVDVDGGNCAVAEVSIEKSAEQTRPMGSLSDDNARKISRAVYVGGASAVVGALGVYAAALGSDGGTSMATNPDVAKGLADAVTSVNTGEAVAAGGFTTGINPRSGDGKVGTLNTSVNDAPIYDPNRPDIDEIEPAPPTGQTNTTPPVSNNPGDPVVPPSGGGGGTQPETPPPPAPDDIPPPPDPIDPMTPS